MSRTILRISIGKNYLVPEPQIHTNGKPAFFIPGILFQASYGRFRMVSGRCIGHISRTKQNNKKGRISSYWLVHDQHRVEKSHIQIRKIERDIHSQATAMAAPWLAQLVVPYTQPEKMLIFRKFERKSYPIVVFFVIMTISTFLGCDVVLYFCRTPLC